MDELEVVSKIRIFLRQEGFIVPKKPVQEFYLDCFIREFETLPLFSF
ncbi:hypothetical protein IAE16_05755 [Hydrogenobacter sp. T-2]|nr:hypothetical protein [Hydrogenobacter sp. T-2]WPM31327.1 hypothetical protein IAE16_05755 [Hydrogenobacter sp. T-2]